MLITRCVNNCDMLIKKCTNKVWCDDALSCWKNTAGCRPCNYTWIKFFQHIQVTGTCHRYSGMFRISCSRPHHTLTLGLSLMCPAVAKGCSDLPMWIFHWFTFLEKWTAASSENIYYLRNLLSLTSFSSILSAASLCATQSPGIIVHNIC